MIVDKNRRTTAETNETLAKESAQQTATQADRREQAQCDASCPKHTVRTYLMPFGQTFKWTWRNCKSPTIPRNSAVLTSRRMRPSTAPQALITTTTWTSLTRPTRTLLLTESATSCDQRCLFIYISGVARLFLLFVCHVIIRHSE